MTTHHVAHWLWRYFTVDVSITLSFGGISSSHGTQLILGARNRIRVCTWVPGYPRIVPVQHYPHCISSRRFISGLLPVFDLFLQFFSVYHSVSSLYNLRGFDSLTTLCYNSNILIEPVVHNCQIRNILPVSSRRCAICGNQGFLSTGQELRLASSPQRQQSRYTALAK